MPDVVEEFRLPIVDRAVIAAIGRGTEIETPEGMLTDETRGSAASAVLEGTGSEVNFRGRHQKLKSIIRIEATISPFSCGAARNAASLPSNGDHMDPQPVSGISDAPLPSTWTWQFNALTPIWTGDAEPRGERLILTGLLGSLRWWFEVLVRGLGGPACDPSGTKCQDRNHCSVCELFGCTGWARKLRFQVLDAQGKTLSSAIAKDAKFQLRFVPLRGIGKEEWALLRLTLHLISSYGAIGGRTIFKPSDENSRANAQHHRDYGLLKFVAEAPTVEHVDRETLEDYVRSSHWREVDHDDFAWASLQNFWYVKGKYLTRTGSSSSSFNKLVGRDERKTCRDCGGVQILRSAVRRRVGLRTALAN